NCPPGLYPHRSTAALECTAAPGSSTRTLPCAPNLLVLSRLLQARPSPFQGLITRLVGAKKHMASATILDDRKYTKEHEWAKQDGETIYFGISACAVVQLGDITLVGLAVCVGDEVTAGKAFGTLESVKAVSDLYATLTG